MIMDCYLTVTDDAGERGPIPGTVDLSGKGAVFTASKPLSDKMTLVDCWIDVFMEDGMILCGNGANNGTVWHIRERRPSHVEWLKSVNLEDAPFLPPYDR